MKKVLQITTIFILFTGFLFAQVPPVEYFNFEGNVETNPVFSNSGASYSGVVENPLKTGVNLTDSVGMSTTGNNSWDGITFRFANSIDLRSDTIFTMLVYHPDSSGSIRLQFNGSAELKYNVEYTTPGEWALLTWNIPKTYDGKFDRVMLVFAHNRGGSGEEWYFDELRGPKTYKVYPPKVYYDTQILRKDWVGFSQATYEGVVANPNPDVINSAPFAGKALTGSANWAGIGYNLPSKINFTDGETFTISVYSDSIGFVRLQLEGGGKQLKISVPYTTPGAWEELEFKASDGTGAEVNNDIYNKVVLIFDDKDSELGEVWYFDKLRGPVIENIDPVKLYYDFETPETQPSIIDVTWDDMSYLGVVENPWKDDINSSDSVGLAMTGSVGWYYIENRLDSYLDFNEGHTFKMKVYNADSTGNARIQIDGEGKNLKMSVPYTTPGAWQELTFDATEVMENSTGTVYGTRYAIMKFLFDDQDGDLAEPWYFDDIYGPALQRLYLADAKFMVTSNQPSVNAYEIEINNSGIKIALYDDGTNGDATADDGVFTVQLKDLPVGNHTMSVYADGSIISYGTDVAFAVEEKLSGTNVEFSHWATSIAYNSLEKFNVYPNPTRGSLSIESFGKNIKSIDIYDITGATVRTTVVNGLESVINMDVSDLNAGIYFIKVSDELGGVNAVRFIKE